MSVAVLLRRKKRIWVGVDRRLTTGSVFSDDCDYKVFKNGPYLFGFVGCIRALNALRFAPLPKPPKSGLARFICTRFNVAVRKAMEASGAYKIEDGSDVMEAAYLVAVNGDAFHVGGDHGVSHIPPDTYAAIGSGFELALGSLFSTETLEPRDRVEMAVRAASAHCNTVGGEPNVVSCG